MGGLDHPSVCRSRSRDWRAGIRQRSPCRPWRPSGSVVVKAPGADVLGLRRDACRRRLPGRIGPWAAGNDSVLCRAGGPEPDRVPGPATVGRPTGNCRTPTRPPEPTRAQAGRRPVARQSPVGLAQHDDPDHSSPNRLAPTTLTPFAEATSSEAAGRRSVTVRPGSLPARGGIWGSSPQERRAAGREPPPTGAHGHGRQRRRLDQPHADGLPVRPDHQRHAVRPTRQGAGGVHGRGERLVGRVRRILELRDLRGRHRPGRGCHRRLVHGRHRGAASTQVRPLGVRITAGRIAPATPGGAGCPHRRQARCARKASTCGGRPVLWRRGIPGAGLRPCFPLAGPRLDDVHRPSPGG
jgi:hypothetical protein